MSRSKILFMMSGSIAAFKACQVVSALVQQGHEVQVVGTSALKSFVGDATLEGLTGKKVLCDLFESGHAMDHIELTRWADIAVLCPASANTLARLALGLADDLVAAMALAWPAHKPFHIFPAMNTQMWSAAPTQNHVKTLEARGFLVAPTGEGVLACGEIGAGRLLEPKQILKILEGEERSRGEILITSGATREPIDGIRFLSNVSTGQTGSALADRLEREGWRVTYLHGQGALQPAGRARTREFSSFNDLAEKLREELGSRDYAAVIHSAAVSDYTPAEIRDGNRPLNADTGLKLSSDRDLSLRLKLNPKLLPRLKEYSRNPQIKVVGFKLTLNASESQCLEAAHKVLSPSIDAVIANDWSQVTRDRSRHPGVFLSRESEPFAFSNLNELTASLNRFFTKGVPS